MWLKKNSAEFFIKLNIGTRIGKDSQILPIRCFTDIAKNRPDPMSDPIIGWSLWYTTVSKHDFPKAALVFIFWW